MKKLPLLISGLAFLTGCVTNRVNSDVDYDEVIRLDRRIPKKVDGRFLNLWSISNHSGTDNDEIEIRVLDGERYRTTIIEEGVGAFSPQKGQAYWVFYGEDKGYIDIRRAKTLN